MAAAEGKTVQARLPERLLVEAEALVRDGWYRDLDDLLLAALRRLLDTHQPDLMEQQIRADVDWGLHGRD
jgi:Arc/MetJ-type ribon-helix-helix transcriptional regulator